MTQKEMIDILLEEYRALGVLRESISGKRALDGAGIRALEARIRAAQDHLVDNIVRVQGKKQERFDEK